MTIKSYPGLTARQSRNLRHEGYRTTQKIKQYGPVFLKAVTKNLWKIVRFIGHYLWQHKKAVFILAILVGVIRIAYWRINLGFTEPQRLLLVVGSLFLLLAALTGWLSRFDGRKKLAGPAFVAIFGFLALWGGIQI